MSQEETEEGERTFWLLWHAIQVGELFEIVTH
jgi:hypothetical protein